MYLVTMAKTPKAINLYKGLSIYRVQGSAKWYVRVWDRKKRKYLVKSTGKESSIEAREVAQEYAMALLKAEPEVDPEYTFKHFALKMLNRSSVMTKAGERSAGYNKSIAWAVQNADWGLLDYFGEMDVRKIRTHTYQEYLAMLNRKRPDLSSSTLNSLMAAFRNVLKVARNEGVIDIVPATPRAKSKDNPRPFFRFHPLVSKELDSYQKLLAGAKTMSDEEIVVRGIQVTEELYDLLLFLTHSFVRPTTTELYSIRHSDVTIAENPRRLILTVRNGKTGYRTANTMPAAVSVYERICERYPAHKSEDFIFLPTYENRTTASKIIQRQFNELLQRESLEIDPQTGKKHMLYSLRHTAICMRIINSEGKVNIFNLAKNAGTSVDQIERFYAKYLPLSAEMARNLQSFGE